MQPISNFTRVSKSQVNATGKKTVTEPTLPTTTRKRKATTTEEDTHPRATARTFSFAPSSDDELFGVAKRACRRPEPTTTPTQTSRIIAPTKGKRPARSTRSRAETAHKPSESTLVGKTRRQGKTVQTKLDGVFKKLDKTAQAGKGKDDLPIHLVELIDLHKAFVKTIMLQFAHNGSNAPIDVRSVMPDISGSWGKRQVTMEDIRRCVAIQTSTKNNTISPFMIADYGRGKVCIERSSMDTSPINEERLYRQFEDNLRLLCTERNGDEMDVDIPLSSLCLGDLPQVVIKDLSSGAKVNLLLAKGQKALTEIKSDIAAKQQEKEVKQTATQNPLLNPDGTKMNLLDRIRMKQLAKANGPLPPSGPELERRAALNRVGDVAATISMLSLSNPMSLPRQAFTMAVILEKLKDSLRTPISKEEGASCVRLIASEVAPDWLRIVTIGGRENIVVQRNSQPVDRVIRERVQKLLG